MVMQKTTLSMRMLLQKNTIKPLVTHKASPSMAALEQNLDEVKDLYNNKLGHS